MYPPDHSNLGFAWNRCYLTHVKRFDFKVAVLAILLRGDEKTLFSIPGDSRSWEWPKEADIVEKLFT